MVAAIPDAGHQNRISEVTRRNIFDILRVTPSDWAGKLDDVDFLSRLYDLQKLPSRDGRFKDAAGDIFQHTVNNNDWERDWVFYDARFDLFNAPDAEFLRFLCEVVHPVVRTDPTEVNKLVRALNEQLKPDGWELREEKKLSGRSIYGAFETDGTVSDQYPIPAKTIIQTVDKLLLHSGEDHLADLLRQSEGNIEWSNHDNWNGGIDYYTLKLRAPVSAFAAIESRCQDVEKLLLKKVKSVTRQFERDIISAVTITPDARLTLGVGARQFSPEILKRIWGEGVLRVFLSHRAEDKIQAAALKSDLNPYGISAFVAHEDIEPNQVWQTEIERALASMHVLVALVTPAFNQSVWCQQEVGFALGRGIPIMALRFGAAPQGFIGSIQALATTVSKGTTLADVLFGSMLKHPRTASLMKETLVHEVEVASSWERARYLKTKLLEVNRFDEPQLQRLEKALSNNEKVAEAWGMADVIKTITTRDRSAKSSG
jgi:hypothetical protein